MEIISIPAGGEDEANLPLNAQSSASNAALLKSSGPGASSALADLKPGLGLCSFWISLVLSHRGSMPGAKMSA